MADVLLALALISIAVFVVMSMMIVHELTKRGVKINFFLLRLYIIKYIRDYRRITLEETGRIGPLYYPCVGAVNLALAFALLGLLLK